jgi:hypothetical protein
MLPSRGRIAVGVDDDADTVTPDAFNVVSMNAGARMLAMPSCSSM